MVTPTEAITPLAGIRAHLQQCSVEYLTQDYSRLGEFDLCIVIAGYTYKEEGEFIPTQQVDAGNEGLARGGDRENLLLPETQCSLIKEGLEYAPKTIVIIEGGSALEIRDWVDEVDALLMAWYPGCRGGEAIANVLFGAVNPAGKLPVTFPRHQDQLPPFEMNSLSVEHGFLQGYHGFDYGDSKGDKSKPQSKPEFPFGYGLSYTQFTLDGLYIRRLDDGFQITVDVTNIGEIPGAAVPQIYVGYPGSSILRAPLTLKGFGRVDLDTQESASVIFEITDESLMYYDDSSLSWRMETCEYQFFCGFDSGNMLLDANWVFRGSDNNTTQEIEDSWHPV